MIDPQFLVPNLSQQNIGLQTKSENQQHFQSNYSKNIGTSPITSPEEQTNVMEELCEKFHGRWDDVIDKLHARMVLLHPDSQECKSVATLFHKSCPATILSIERVQALSLWEGYQLKRVQMMSLAASPNEMTLFHGTQKDIIPRINQVGFDKGFSKVAYYGNGVYFALNASYSASKTYSAPDSQGIQRMYLAFVLVGTFTKGEQGMVAPPPVPNEQHILCDSVVDNVAKPAVFVVFKDNQAYPAYVISFKA